MYYGRINLSYESCCEGVWSVIGESYSCHVKLGIMMLTSRKQRSLAHPDLIYQKGLSWIVIQNQLTVNRLPKLEEEIIVETVSAGYTFFTFPSLYHLIFKRKKF